MKVVRWLGSYGKANSLHASLQWELGQSVRQELAAEPIEGCTSGIPQSKIGLLAARTAVIKIFNGDCWSILVPFPSAEDGDLAGASLKKTRNPRCSTLHREAWIRPEYRAIVVKGWNNIRPSTQKTLRWFAEMYHLPILDMNREWKEVGK